MPRVEIYSSFFCGFCHRAKSLLKAKGLAFEDIDVLMHPGRRAEMVERAGGGHTVPQIFIDDRHIGGCQELYELERSGKLDRLIAQEQ
jgi:glutaredoxin 3